MKDRIKKLMESQHMTQQTFAQVTGISPASLSSIFTGRTKPTLNHVEAIQKKFPNINLGWLLNGSEPMFLNQTPQTTAESTHVESSTSSIESEPLLDFGNLPKSPSPSLFEQPLQPSVQPTPKNIEKP